MARPKKPAKPAPATVEELTERFKDFPAADILTRRFQQPDDFSSLPILLKDEPRESCCNSEHQNALHLGQTICQYQRVDKETGRFVEPPCGRPVRRWRIRWANTAQEGRWSQIRALGWVSVEIRELHDVQDVSDLVKGPDAAVRRGDRGQEILVKQPLDAYIELKRRQREQRTRRDTSRAALQQDLAEAAGQQLGDEAGTQLAKGAITVESLSAKRTTLGAELEE